MDLKPSSPEKDPWVDSRMASLDAAPEWNPDAGSALQRLTQPSASASSQWMRLGMTATILATTAVVLVLLPWQRLWTPEPVATPVAKVAAVQERTPAPEPAKPVEKPAPEGKVLKDVQGGFNEQGKFVEMPTIEAKTEGQKVPFFDDIVYVSSKKLPVTLETGKTGVAAPPPQDSQNTRINPSDRPSDRLQEYYDIQRPPSAKTEPTPDVVIRPTIVQQVMPKYTDQAREAKVVGVVELVVTVNTDGSVRFESVKKGLGNGLDEAAREAVEQWRFTPGMKDGVPVAVTVVIDVSFTLR